MFDKVLECEKEIYLMGDFIHDLFQENLKKTPNNIISVDVPSFGLSDHFRVYVTRKINSLSGVKNII